jgi:iron complex transport system permease protein
MAETGRALAERPPLESLPARRGAIRAGRRRTVLTVLCGLLLAAAVANIGLGAVGIAPQQVIAILADRIGVHLGVAYTEQQDAVLWAIRLPRVALAALVGCGLGIAGAALQGIFRNPLADPGLIGVSSGAAVGAAGTIVLGVAPLGLATVPLAAFLGGAAATALVYACARYRGRTEVVTLLLCGIAVNTIAGAVIGLFTVLADDAELRSIVFWSLGSMGGATWPTVASIAPLIAVAVLLLPRLAGPLDLLALGEREAGHLGVPTERVRIVVVTLAALATGAGVAAAGIVGFVGLVVPHIVRLLTGPGHRTVLPASAVGGAVTLLVADLVARTVAIPAEVPLGVVTAILGGPFFLALVVRTRRRHGGWG